MEWETYLLIIGYIILIIILSVSLMCCCGMNKVVVDEKPDDLP